MKKFVTRNKIIILIIFIIILITVVISSSYALYYNNYKAEETESYQTGSLDIEYSNSSALALSNNVPLNDIDGLATDPYSITITNTGNLTYQFNVLLLEEPSDNIINANYIKIKVNDEPIQTLSSLVDSKILQDVVLAPSESIVVNIKIWLDEYTPNSEIGKTFEAKLATDGQGIYKVNNE